MFMKACFIINYSIIYASISYMVLKIAKGICKHDRMLAKVKE